MHLPQSSRTKRNCFRYCCALTGYGPNCLTTFWTQLTYHFNGRTTQPWEYTPTPGYDEPTSRCQTFLLIRTLKKNQPVIPRVTFIRCSKTLLNRVIGSLRPAVALVQPGSLTIKPFFAFVLNNWFPSKKKNLCAPLLLYER